MTPVINGDPHRLTKIEVVALAERALQAAIEVVNHGLGIDHSHLSPHFFADDRVESILRDYIHRVEATL